MKSIDHQQTIVLLIGATEFPHDEKKNLEPIPNIAVNLDKLKNLLTNPNIMGIPEKNITISLNHTKAEVEGHLADLKKKTSNPKTNLLVYYAGHGYPDFFAQKYHVFLTTYSTNTDKIKQGAISTADFADYIKECNSERKLIILDACYSGEFINADTMGDADSQITVELNNFSGTYVMTSVSKDNTARFPKENTNAPTYFTGELIEVLENGLDKNEHFLNTKDIFLSVKSNLLKKQLPEPKSHNKDQADDLLWAKNVWFDKYAEKRKEIEQQKAVELRKLEVSERRDEFKYWQTAINTNALADFKNYLLLYPKGIFVEQAQENIKNIEGLHDLVSSKKENINLLGTFFAGNEINSIEHQQQKKELLDVSVNEIETEKQDEELNMQTTFLKLFDGSILTVYLSPTIKGKIGLQVRLNNEIPPDGIYTSVQTQKTYLIKNGVITFEFNNEKKVSIIVKIVKIVTIVIGVPIAFIILFIIVLILMMYFADID